MIGFGVRLTHFCRKLMSISLVGEQYMARIGIVSRLSKGNDAANQVITVFLNTSTFIGGLTAFLLDNSIPVTDEERRLMK
ncbi:solute carrier family 23 member 2-like [Tachypleus tridentatus]|uniref:solute carrier family 23 member 2-like n=1 Tax=Tachypleus tridentatus TaxID=6853 RepID=UPI003FCF195F